jgi:hypothetical protein
MGAETYGRIDVLEPMLTTVPPRPPRSLLIKRIASNVPLITPFWNFNFVFNEQKKFDGLSNGTHKLI